MSRPSIANSFTTTESSPFVRSGSYSPYPPSRFISSISRGPRPFAALPPHINYNFYTIRYITTLGTEPSKIYPSLRCPRQSSIHLYSRIQAVGSVLTVSELSEFTFTNPWLLYTKSPRLTTSHCQQRSLEYVLFSQYCRRPSPPPIFVPSVDKHKRRLVNNRTTNHLISIR